MGTDDLWAHRRLCVLGRQVVEKVECGRACFVVEQPTRDRVANRAHEGVYPTPSPPSPHPMYFTYFSQKAPRQRTLSRLKKRSGRQWAPGDLGAKDAWHQEC